MHSTHVVHYVSVFKHFLCCVQYKAQYIADYVGSATRSHYSMRGYTVLVLVAAVAGVNSQSYPHFEFRGDVLVNNSFIVRGLIGEGHNDSLHCVTDNSDCCTNGQGNWSNETGGEVQQESDGDSNLYVTRGDGVVYLNRRTGGSTGMWRCDIPDSNGVKQSIYIYLGTPTSGIHSICNLYFSKPKNRTIEISSDIL